MGPQVSGDAAGSRRRQRLTVVVVGLVAALAVGGLVAGAANASGRPATGVVTATAIPADQCAPETIGYLRVEGAPGESTLRGFEKQIEVVSVESGVANPVAAGRGSGAGAGRPTVTPLRARVRLDASYPVLVRLALQGRVVRTAKLSLVKAMGESTSAYASVGLTDAFVTAVTLKTPPGCDQPLVDVALLGSTVTWTYVPQKPDGSAGTPVSTIWDARRNRVS